MFKFSRRGTSHLVFPVRSTIPGVSDQPPCLDWLEQLSRLDWNGEIVLLSQTGEKVPVPAVLLLAASQVVQGIMKSVPSLLLDSASITFNHDADALKDFRTLLTKGEITGISSERKEEVELLCKNMSVLSPLSSSAPKLELNILTSSAKQKQIERIKNNCSSVDTADAQVFSEEERTGPIHQNIQRNSSLETPDSEIQRLGLDLTSDEEDPAMARLCDYEKVRLKNIRQREELFASLNFEAAKSDLALALASVARRRKHIFKVKAQKKKRQRESSSSSSSSSTSSSSEESSSSESSTDSRREKSKRRIEGLKCSECGRVFKWKRNLIRHQINVHNSKNLEQIKDIRFHCDFCGMSYSRERSLKDHREAVHMGRTYPCRNPNCSYVGPSKSAEDKHFKNHHVVGGKEMYSCDRCGKSFTKKCYLNKHKNRCPQNCRGSSIGPSRPAMLDKLREYHFKH